MANIKTTSLNILASVIKLAVRVCLWPQTEMFFLLIRFWNMISCSIIKKKWRLPPNTKYTHSFSCIMSIRLITWINILQKSQGQIFKTAVPTTSSYLAGLNALHPWESHPELIVAIQCSKGTWTKNELGHKLWTTVLKYIRYYSVVLNEK